MDAINYRNANDNSCYTSCGPGPAEASAAVRSATRAFTARKTTPGPQATDSAEEVASSCAYTRFSIHTAVRKGAGLVTNKIAEMKNPTTAWQRSTSARGSGAEAESSSFTSEGTSAGVSCKEQAQVR